MNFKEIVEQLPFGMTGADLSSLCADAYMTAISRIISQSEVIQGLLYIYKNS